MQYFYKDIHHKTKLAKRWEVERESMVFAANMNIAEVSKKLVATDLFYLITDKIPEKVSYAVDDEDNETPAELYKRMAANNFYLPDIKNKDMNN